MFENDTLDIRAALIKAAAQDRRKVLVVLDRDGTIDPFRVIPEHVRTLGATEKALWELTEHFRTAVLTGRQDAWASPRSTWADIVAGSNGASIRLKEIHRDEAWLDQEFHADGPRVRDLVLAKSPKDVGLVVQDQGSSWMLHWRHLDGRALADALSVVGVIVAVARSEGFNVKDFAQGVEIGPAKQVLKNLGLTRILAATGVQVSGADYDGRVLPGPPPDYVVLMADAPEADLPAFTANVRCAEVHWTTGALNVAVVHRDRPENQPLWDAADVCVEGIPGATGFIRGLAAEIECAKEELALDA